MTTFAPKQGSQEKLSELDERTRVAWSEYQHDLRDLEGDAYAEAEPEAWERLQTTLGRIGDERADVTADAGAAPSGT